MKKKKILFVATNIDLLGKNENGTYLIEIAYPFQHFIDKGFEVDIVTPKGGLAPTYPKEYAGPGLGKIQRSELFISKTNNSISPNKVNTADYMAVFYPGGYGHFFDVVNDERISRLVAKIYEHGGIIGSTGHGTASLINIKLSNNNYLVEGKKITCFPHWMEIQKMWQSEYGKLLPFDMQDVLLKRGANLIVCPDGLKTNKECTQVIDHTNRMVTGAFADDALWVAEEMVKLMSQTTK
ncbi:MAG: type 1 glutamine amidotransferase domain-containing protein [bacterium]|nr:type 1 glutamine amidotransferase domain-containing protein [bacterium]